MLDSVLLQVVQRRMLDFVLEAESTAQTTDADGSSTQPCSAVSAPSSSESMGSAAPSARGENGDKIGSGPQKRGSKKRPTQSESQTRQREEDLLLQIEREKQLLLEKQAQLALRVSSSVGRPAAVMSTDSAPPPSCAGGPITRRPPWLRSPSTNGWDGHTPRGGEGSRLVALRSRARGDQGSCGCCSCRESGRADAVASAYILHGASQGRPSRPGVTKAWATAGGRRMRGASKKGF